ncbi:hypothetical protein ACLINH_003665, partial [Vibrio cholerae]
QPLRRALALGGSNMKSALLVVDVQNGVFGSTNLPYLSENVINNIKQLLSNCWVALVRLKLKLYSYNMKSRECLSQKVMLGNCFQI